ncbi:hypothetical protein OY671_004049 [Metschnikowia pulcherrima]|nr:hypothetical protein OY671_004049 [Metschnikowia pulcherrima]
MEASCGPENVLQQLTKHTQRDNSLQHERQANFSQNQQNAFRSGPGLDPRLNSDFQRFSQGHYNEFEPQNQRVQNPTSVGGQNLHTQHSGPAFRVSDGGRTQEWVSDFSGLSLHDQQALGRNETMSHIQGPNQISNRGQNQGQKVDWHHQFMQNMQASRQAQHQNQPLQNSAHYGTSQFSSFQPMMNHYNQHQAFNQEQTQPQNQANTSLEGLEVDEEALARHFDMLEAEMAQETHENEDKTALDNNKEKEKFAEAARQVHATMVAQNPETSSETASKFQHSNFLHLMASIAERQVEISQEGDKLVSSSTGEDIRQHLSDPLRHERESEPDYHKPPHENAQFSTQTRSNESENIRNHLPDPLAHLRDGALDSDLSPLQAAQVISGGQVQENSWMEDEMWGSFGEPERRRGPSLLSAQDQEIYDDYRHDDHQF